MSIGQGFSELTQVAAVLRGTPQLLNAQLTPLDESLLTWRIDPEEWCIKEVVGHLIAADQQAFLARIQLMLAEENPMLGGMDVHAAARNRRDDQRPLTDLLLEMEAQRAEMAAFVARLTGAEMARTGVYPPHGIFSVADFVYEWPYHDAAHIKQIQDLLQAQITPHLGATMRAALGV